MRNFRFTNMLDNSTKSVLSSDIENITFFFFFFYKKCVLKLIFRNQKHLLKKKVTYDRGPQNAKTEL